MAFSSDNSFSIDNLKNVSFNFLSILKKSGFYSLKDLIVRGPFEVSSETGIDIDDSFIIYNQAVNALEGIGVIEKQFVPATTIYYKRKNIGKISTGSKNFDNLLGGGIETKSITEVCGEFGTGKTQLCYTASIMVQQDYSNGGLKGNALYIDTENTFRPERVESISRFRNLNPIKVLDNIIVAKAYSSSHYELILTESSKLIDSYNIKLMVIDSIISLYRSEFIGLSALSERQQRLNKLIHSIMRIAETFEIAVLLTNQVQGAPDSIFDGNSLKAAGGNIMAHSTTYRIFLRKSGRNRIARMIDSPYHAESDAIFTIGDDGISDPINQ